MSVSATLELTLRSPVAISATSATVSGHRSLTWVPGAHLLGAAARAMRLDPSAPLPERAWRILCSGEVRFGDAWPADGREPAFVAPLCLHHPKGEVDAAPWNLVRAERPGTTQLEQLRGRHVSAEGRLVQPRRSHTLRTAMEEGGRAREGLLFGIDALEAGERFLAQIAADTSQLLEEVIELLLRSSPIRVGRSRSAEFGVVDLQRVDGWEDPPQAPPREGELVVWLISDLALRDRATGGPRLVLEPGDLGLPVGWRRDAQRTFVRTRRYSPFNGARRRPDLERQVLEAGSVVVFRGDTTLDREAIEASLSGGLGDHVQEGLGRVVLDPALLAEPTVTLLSRQVPDDAPAPRPDDALGRWLGRRIEEQRLTVAREEAARQLGERLRAWRIRSSQWGRIRQLARQARYLQHGDRWLAREVCAFLGHGARLHIWRRHAERFIEEAEGQEWDPAILELATATLMLGEQG